MKRLVALSLIVSLLLTPIATWAGNGMPAILTALEEEAAAIPLDDATMLQVRGTASCSTCMFAANPVIMQLLMLFFILNMLSSRCSTCG